MGKKSGTQTVSQDPWGPAQGSLQFGLGELNRIYQAMNPGSMGPGYTQSMGGGMGGGMASPAYLDPRQGGAGYRRPGMGTLPFAGGQAQPQTQSSQAPYDLPEIADYGLLDPAAAELLSTIKGERLNSNPYLDEVIRRASADVNSQFAGMGRYASGAHADQLFSKAAAPIRYADYARERANQLSAISQAPGFSMAPYQLYSAKQAAPYEGIRNYLDLVGGIGRGGSQQSSPIYKNSAAGLLGGALGGYQLGSGLGGAAFGPWGALVGGLLGGLG